jgi:hypothetical protein
MHRSNWQLHSIASSARARNIAGVKIAPILIQIKDKPMPRGVRLNNLEGKGGNDVRHHPKIFWLR